MFGVSQFWRTVTYQFLHGGLGGRNVGDRALDGSTLNFGPFGDHGGGGHGAAFSIDAWR